MSSYQRGQLEKYLIRIINTKGFATKSEAMEVAEALGIGKVGVDDYISNLPSSRVYWYRYKFWRKG